MILEELFSLIKKRKEKMPKGSYTSSLFKDGTDRIIQKVGEEAVEVVIAAKSQPKQRVVSEVSDLFYHILVMLADLDIEFDAILKELEKRKK